MNVHNQSWKNFVGTEEFKARLYSMPHPHIKSYHLPTKKNVRKVVEESFTNKPYLSLSTSLLGQELFKEAVEKWMINKKRQL